MFDEPQDMFAETESGAAPVAVAQPRASAPLLKQEGSGVVPEPRGGFPWKGVLVVVAVFLVIGAAAGLSFLLLSARSSPTPGVPDVSNAVSEDTGTPVQPTASQPPAAPAQPAVTPSAAPEPDQDQDGLTDAQEAQLGTSPVKADTDADGLFDREELEVYKTDPLNPDTDGDTYKDGDEVKNGYNPNGPGKLLSPPPSTNP